MTLDKLLFFVPLREDFEDCLDEKSNYPTEESNSECVLFGVPRGYGENHKDDDLIDMGGEDYY